MSKQDVAVGAQDSYGTMAEETQMQGDPILAPSLPTSPSRSRAVKRPIRTIEGESAEPLAEVTENDPLLGGGGHERRKKKPFYRARPMWYAATLSLVITKKG